MNASSGIKGYLFLSASFLICLLSCFLPISFIITSVFIISFFVAAFPFVHRAFLIAVPLLSVIAALFLKNNPYITFLIFSLYLTAALICFLITKEKSVKQIFFAATVFESICAILTLFLFIYIRGGSLSANALQYVLSPLTIPLREYCDYIIKLYESVSPELVTQVSELINQSYDVIIGSLNNAIFSFVICFICYMVLFSLFISKNLLRLCGFDIYKMGRFKDFSLEKSAAVVMIICLFGQMLFENSLGIAFYNLYTVLSTLFVFVGIAFVVFFMERMNISALAKKILTFLIAVICILPFSISSLIGALGAVDALFGIRKKIENAKIS